MPAVIALLRGVNIGSRRMKMEMLRAVCERLKLKDVQTYVQSGNVVFRSASTDMKALQRKLEAAIAKEFGFHAEVMLRTTDDLRAVVAANPFASRTDVEPARLLVHFLSSEAAELALDKLGALPKDGEELHLSGLSLYVHYPKGAGQSKIATKIDKALQVSTTARNWNSVAKLLEMAEKLS